ncbi:SPOR domain-containing protein [bacterium]|nr:SPOR domain-containing protein [bacterium]MBU1958833.1 SPOR domain-containing protein [bacterium]
MADKNLHDIKIDDLDHQKKTPLKNILTLLALLFIILVISVVITKLILNTDEGQVIDNNLTSSEISTETDADTNDSNALAVAGGALAGVASTVASTTNDAATNVSNAVSTPIVKERNVSNTSKTKVTLRDHQPTKTVKELGNTNKTTTTKAPKKTYIETKEVVKETAAKTSVASYNLSTGYYIKVGTFKDISTAVEKVKKTGLNYKLIKPKNDKTMTRVLIGPFSEEEAAKSHLKEVQTNITSGAYITRIK